MSIEMEVIFMQNYQESKDRYLREKVENITLRVPKGEKDKIQAFAKTKARSTNAYILELIKKDMSNVL
jgi:hypothetical protein